LAVCWKFPCEDEAVDPLCDDADDTCCDEAAELIDFPDPLLEEEKLEDCLEAWA